MASSEEIREIRLKKLETLKKKGINPYPVFTRRDYALDELVDKFDTLAKSGKKVCIVGRVMSLRPQGALTFTNLDDGTARFQALLKKDKMAEGQFDFFTEVVDIGDFIEISGTLFITKRGEKTLEASEWRMLTKSLLPLPEKWHGLQDVEERFRHRYLDTLMSPEVKERFILRSRIITSLRKILDKNGYIEVETPALQPLAGGTNALPFTTHHNALDMNLFLRIAPELYLKKLLIGGFTKVYEIGRNFRNEGIDVTHNPEFTMLEFYEAYSSSEEQLKFVEKIFQSLVKEIFDSYFLDHSKEKIDFSKKFERISYRELLEKHAGLDPYKTSKDELVKRSSGLNIKLDKTDSQEKIIDYIYKKIARPKIIQPTFITEYPLRMLPLAKRSESNPDAVDVFQLVCGGMELVKAFSELNDPLDQRERFDQETEKAIAGDKEAQPNDIDFINALEYGMPPAGGVGIGIDRVVMLLTGVKNIKEVILFPTLRPERG